MYCVCYSILSGFIFCLCYGFIFYHIVGIEFIVCMRVMAGCGIIASRKRFGGRVCYDTLHVVGVYAVIVSVLVSSMRS